MAAGSFFIINKLGIDTYEGGVGKFVIQMKFFTARKKYEDIDGLVLQEGLKLEVVSRPRGSI